MNIFDGPLEFHINEVRLQYIRKPPDYLKERKLHPVIYIYTIRYNYDVNMYIFPPADMIQLSTTLTRPLSTV